MFNVMFILLADLRLLPDKHVYVSCFREVEQNREFQKQMQGIDINAMKPSTCARRCRIKLFTYAALQVRLGDTMYSSDFYWSLTPTRLLSR